MNSGGYQPPPLPEDRTMRIHKLIEHLQNVKEKPTLHKDSLAMLNDLNMCSSHFAFGDIDPIPDKEWVEVNKYSKELAQHGLFQLPFDCVCYEWSHAIAKVRQHYNYIISEVPDDLKDKFLSDAKVKGDNEFLRRITPNDGQPLYFLVMLITADVGHGIAVQGCSALFNVSTIGDEEGKIFIFNATNIFNGDLLDMKGGEPFIGGLNDCITLHGFLNCDGVDQHIEPSPKVLNIKRAKKGKPPIPEINTIYIRVGDSYPVREGVGEGSHASKRCHMRRGHVRHYSNGLITNVRPSIINAGKGNKPTASEYKVRYGRYLSH
jgi:hypothetical protein